MGYDIGETAKRLKESRKAKHLTQMQVEDKTKMQIPQSTLSDYEKGKRAPKAEDIYELSCVYDVSADYLLGLQDDKTKSLEMKTIIKTTGFSEKAIENFKELNTYYKSLYDVACHGEEYLNNLPSKIIASQNFKKLTIEFFKILRKYCAVSENLSDEEFPLVLPDDATVLKYGKYTLGEYCNNILNEITSGVKGIASFNEITEKANMTVQSLIESSFAIADDMNK